MVMTCQTHPLDFSSLNVKGVSSDWESTQTQILKLTILKPPVTWASHYNAY